MDHIDELLTRRVDQVFPSKSELEKILRSDQKLRLYQGFDPSKPNLHIGHLVGLLQLRAFQDLGHQVVFLIGDFTGMIGDPTDKSATRPKLSKQEVLANAQTYKDQAGKILRFDGDNAAQIKFNSSWLQDLSFADIIELSSNFTVQQMIERDMFQDRLKNNRPIFLHEFLYPLMVTKDAIELNVDLEIGGTDQLFNMTVGRSLIKQITGKDKFALTTKLLTDAQGRKIGKTTGNAINLFGDPTDLFGSVMSLPDETLISALNLVTNLPLSDIQTLTLELKDQPMLLKKRLAFEIVKLCHDSNTANTAENFFELTIQNKQIPADLITIHLAAGTTTPLAVATTIGWGNSNSQRRQIIEQGGFELNSQKITNPLTPFEPKNGDILKYGKREYRSIKIG